MSRLNLLHECEPTISSTSALDAGPVPIHQLIVLVPDADSDATELARRIWELAVPEARGILLLGLCPHPSEEARLRRRLVTMAAVMRASKVPTQVQMELGHDWVKTVKTAWHPGDSVVCPSEQQTGLRPRPLSQVLASNLRVPIYVLSSSDAPGYVRVGSLSRIISWAGSIGIIYGFFWIQVRIVQLSKDWAHTALFYLSVVIEISLILVWNSLSS
jgi:hypothetical protein